MISGFKTRIYRHELRYSLLIYISIIIPLGKLVANNIRYYLLLVFCILATTVNTFSTSVLLRTYVYRYFIILLAIFGFILYTNKVINYIIYLL